MHQIHICYNLRPATPFHSSLVHPATLFRLSLVHHALRAGPEGVAGGRPPRAPEI